MTSSFPKCSNRLRDERVALFAGLDVRRDDERLLPRGGLDLGRRALELGDRAACDADVGPGLGERDRHRLPEPGAHRR